MGYFPVFEVAAVLGGSLVARLAFIKPRTIPELMERVDMDFALKCCALDRAFDEKEWCSICNPIGLWHMIRQADLLTRIVMEMRKAHPGPMPPAIPQLWKLCLRCLLERSVRRFLPASPWTYGPSCAHSFVGIFEIATENQ